MTSAVAPVQDEARVTQNDPLGEKLQTPSRDGGSPASSIRSPSAGGYQQEGSEILSGAAATPITFVVYDRGRREISMPYTGAAMRYYLKAAGLLVLRFRLRLLNSRSENVRLAYTPHPGEHFRMLPPSAPFGML